MTHQLFWTFCLLVSSPALAGKRMQTIDLPNCGGLAEIISNDRQTLIQFKDVDDCSNLTINSQKMKMQRQNSQQYTYVYTWQPSLYREQITLRLHSNSGKTEDYVRLRSDEENWSHNDWKKKWARPARWEASHPVRDYDDSLIYLDDKRNTAWLPECGGQIRISIEQQRLLVKLEGGSQACEKVRLTVLNQRPLSMESIRRSDRSCQSWSFPLPERSLQAGRNSLTLKIESARENRSDLVRYYFSDQRWFFASGSR